MATNANLALPSDHFIKIHQFTDTTHRDIYPSIDPSSPKLSQRGKKIVVIGAGRGIGKAIAQAFVKADVSRMLLVGRDVNSLQVTAAELKKMNPSVDVTELAAEITSEDSVDRLEEVLRSCFGTPDILVNAAGSWLSIEPLGNSIPQHWWKDFEVNLKGGYLVIRAVLRVVGQHRDVTIINVNTWGMLTTGQVAPSYAISKLSMHRLLETIPSAYPRAHCMSYHPGMVKTDLAYAHPEVLPFCEDTVELAAATAVYLASPQAQFLSGRYMSANWDVDELESKRHEIIEKDLLRMDLRGNFGCPAPAPFYTVTMYPVKDGEEFDMERMINKHMPLAMDRWNEYGLLGYQVIQFGAFGDKKQPYYGQLLMKWRDAECPNIALNSEGAKEIDEEIKSWVPIFGVSMTGKIIFIGLSIKDEVPHYRRLRERILTNAKAIRVMATSNLIKYRVEHFRKEGVSAEDFEKFFTEVHLAAALPLMRKYGFVKYAVERRNPELAAAFEPMLHSVHPTWNVSEADIVIQYWFPSMECLKKLVADPDWDGKAVKGQEDWIQIEKGTVSLCHETTYIDEGEILQILSNKNSS
ncbi:uncharacterized protein PV09_08297 [Verruconis gallopava]|uniref:EthD domain-containing protein n=1 Tax=Verruconis gallopava TaxID=253628 RepID=A0A0D2A1C2_9PEZI|nr:uncharacterized protein PV09_08297 [Verruconis gallopava]KIW00115.1 hypothetical protein PV09_08297 [Verruconis gallopava]